MAAPSTFIIPSSPMDRRTLGKFEVLCRLSTGGMSEIYLAQQGGVGGFNKLVVLKTILPDIVGEEDFVRMFLDEARTTAAFNHPNIAQVFELDTAQDTLFMAMEFVQGCTLVEMARACRAAREAIPVGLTLASVRDTALALHYAHGFTDPRGRRQIVIHRDVAEKNIMVTYEGVTKLLDFGIAKALGRTGRTSVGMVKGTSGYMSPEQIRGEPLDPRSDIFSLGVVLHECLTGLRLFHGKNAEEGMMAALKGEVAPPSKWNPEVSPELDAIVLKALAKDRDARFTTALEMARAIERAAPGLIWHPEQIGELVVRHFKDRRAETRRMLEAAFGQEATGEIRVKTIMAKIRAGTGSLTEPPLGARSNPAAAAVTAPNTPTAPPQGATQPAIAPHQPAATLEVVTTPARARIPRPSAPNLPASAPQVTAPTPAPAPSVPRAQMETAVARPQPLPSAAPKSINLTPNEFDDDDDSEAKTIPAAALPDEIKALRKRILEEAEARKRLDAPPVLRPADVTEPRRPTPAPQKLAAAAGSKRTESGETLSITHKQDWSDEVRPVAREEATRAMGPALSTSSNSSDDFVPTRSEKESNQRVGSTIEALDPVADHEQGRSRTVLIGVLVVLGVVLLFGSLVLFDVIPLLHAGK
jgi:hypothetical protein